jgi:hypothetical protein
MFRIRFLLPRSLKTRRKSFKTWRFWRLGRLKNHYLDFSDSLLDKGIFRKLKDPRMFNTVKPVLGSIQWQGGQDFCPDTLFMDSELLEELQASAKV